MSKSVSLSFVLALALLFAAGHASAFVDAKSDNFRRVLDSVPDKSVLCHTGGDWFPYPDYSDREGWDTLSRDFKSKLISSGEKRLIHKWTSLTTEDYLLYEKTGNRAIFAPEEANREALKDLTLAELVEGKGRFLDQIAAGLDCFCGKISWSHPQHTQYQSSGKTLPVPEERPITYHSAYNASTIAISWHFLKGELDKRRPGLSAKVREALKVNILRPYLKPLQAGHKWMGFSKDAATLNNHTTNENMHCTLCFLLAEENPDTLRIALSQSLEIMDKYLSCIKHDGACEEGSSYWKASFGKLYQYSRMLYDFSGGKLDCLKEPLLKKMGEYKAHAYMGGGYHMNYGDGASRDYVSPGLLFRFGKDTGSELLCDFALYMLIENATKFDNGVLVNKNVDIYMSLETMRYENRLVAAEKSALASAGGDVFALRTALSDKASVWYPETQYAIFRNGKGWTLAAKGASNFESHNHNDVGSFMLYVNNMPVCIDPGVGTYTADTFGGPQRRYSIWTMRSDWHNLPVINGCLQLPGEQYASEGNECDTEKALFSTHIQKAYDPECKCLDWKRTYHLGESSLEITDTFALDERRAPDVINFVVRGDVKVVGKGAVEITAYSFDKKESATFELTFPTSLSVTVEPHDCTYDAKMKRSWGESIARISLASSPKAPKEGKYNYTIKAK